MESTPGNYLTSLSHGEPPRNDKPRNSQGFNDFGADPRAQGGEMTRFVQSEDRRQGVLLPEYLDDYVAEDNPVRVIDVFVDELDLGALGFDGVIPEATGRPAYHPGALLKIYVYGYINQIASSRRLERATHRRQSDILERRSSTQVNGSSWSPTR
jgi:Transposase domain (DUF772)